MKIVLAALAALCVSGCASERRTEAVYAPVAVAAPGVCAPSYPGGPARCDVPQFAAPQYGTPVAYRTETRMTLSSQGAQAVAIPPNLLYCVAGFAKCVWDTVLMPILP